MCSSSTPSGTRSTRRSRSPSTRRGPIEGITLRITLDSQGHPRLYETVYNCGCSHRVFVDRETEEAAAHEYGQPEAGRPYSVQRSLDDRIDWIVPELVDLVPGRRPIFFVRGGHHFPAAIRYEAPAAIDLSNAESYEVRPYAELERTPFQGDWASVFDEKGLVRGAHRTMEEIMLTPLGLYRAGHPRQRGTQLIHFDQADFDDPTLFENLPPPPLRLLKRDSSSRWVVTRATTGLFVVSAATIPPSVALDPDPGGATRTTTPATKRQNGCAPVSFLVRSRAPRVR